jgi:hypothetical protein
MTDYLYISNLFFKCTLDIILNISWSKRVESSVICIIDNNIDVTDKVLTYKIRSHKCNNCNINY